MLFEDLLKTVVKKEEPKVMVAHEKLFALALKSSEEKKEYISPQEYIKRNCEIYAQEEHKPAELVHPNSPSLWTEPIAQPIFNYFNRPMQNGPIQYTPYQQQMIGNMNNHINQRGPWRMNYVLSQAGPMNHPDQPNSRKWIDRYSQQMERDLNDPVKIGLPYYGGPIRYTGFGPNFVPADPNSIKTDADLEDQNYFRLKRINEEDIANRDKKSSIRSLNENRPSRSTRLSNEEAEAMKQIRMSKSTPSINPKFLDYNYVSKSGEGYWSLGKAQQDLVTDIDMSHLVNPQERAYIHAAALKGYNTARPLGSDLRQNPLDDSEEDQEYEQAGYEEYMRHRYGFVPTYNGYFGGSGYTDENGLPTRWFDDGKYYRLTKEDYEKGRFAHARLIFEGDDIKEEIKPVKQKKPLVRKVRLIMVDSSGNITDVYASELKRYMNKDELEEYIKSHNAEKDKEDALEAKRKNIPTEKEQYLGDDSFFLARELSRYNEYLANMLLWYRANATDRDYQTLITKCRQQLTLYRNEDPFASIKAGVINAGRKVVIIDPKPTSDEEIERLIADEKKRADKFYDELIQSGMSSYKAKKIAYVELNALAKCTTLKEKIVALRSLRNFKVISDDKDLALKLVDEIKKLMSPLNMENFSTYIVYKEISRLGRSKESFADPLDRFDELYDKWWNIPRRKPETEKDYEKMYRTRMYELESQMLDEFSRNKLPDDYFLNMRNQAFNREVKRLENLCKDKDGNPLPFYQSFANLRQDWLESQLDQAARDENGPTVIMNRIIEHNLPNFRTQFNPMRYDRTGVPVQFQMNPSMVPIFNNPGLYENKQQMFINSMFHKRQLGGVL